MNHLLALILCFGFLQSHCTTPYEPNEESVSEILKTLSSDEMRGRQALTADVAKAEDFIAEKFNQAGLSTFPGLSDFKQSFSLTEVSIGNASLALEGQEVGDSKFFALLNGENITWNEASIETSVISSGDNFRQKFREYSSSEQDYLVFVDPSFSDIFGRYQTFFSRPNRIIEGEENANTLFILAKPSTSFSIKIIPEIHQKELANVVGVIEGKRKDEYVLFSAHHDHIGIRTPVEGDSVANGANDNASGVTAVIELAKYFKSLGTPERTLLFVTFTAEEMGGYGSTYFSKQLNPDEIMAMFNIEMIGKPAVSGPNTAWITGYERSNFGELLSKSAEGTIYEFYPDPYPQQNLFYRSDNATLARLGVPAHTISTTPIDVDKDYHEVSDHFETINISHLTNTIKAIAKAGYGIVSGKDTPTRVDTELVD
ncbi:MAG: M20/M25/M40 family metallo-hydrolase [Balneolaceae bacterium]|nr:M20/M25/M40 family metallo-hydrolase [Balneolaceae bacterium]MBO6546848.1 M20/M25/M40 family metallo-hydrolase [Balneolaceae bacterium]MBO6649208.1 M20/M25/M40 family metallo-hydrolase [Balneolaceae bacterium]